MARILNTRPLLQELMCSVGEHGHSGYKLPIVGSLRSVLQNLWAYEAVVDNWPNYKSIILRPHQEEVHRFKFHHKNIYCYGDVEAFAKLVNQPNVIPWDRSLFFHAVPDNLLTPLSEAAAKNGGKLENRHGQNFATIALPYEDLKARTKGWAIDKLRENVPEGFTLGTLRPEHAETVLDNWSASKVYIKPGDHATRESWVEEIRQSIAHCITSAVYNPSGEPVCWQLIRLDGDSGFAHTLPEYRQMGLYSLMGSFLALQSCQAAHDNFGYTIDSNTTQQYITMQKFGYSNVGTIGFRFYEPNQAHL